MLSSSLGRENKVIAIGTSSLSQLTQNQTTRFLEKALELGIRSFDTAPLYGKTERCLGQVGISSNLDFEISTKFGLPKQEVYTAKKLRESLEKSLIALQRPYIESFFIHSIPFSNCPAELFEELENLKNEGLIKRFGYSGDNDDLANYLNRYRMGEIMISLNPLDMKNLEIVKTDGIRPRVHIKRPLGNAVWRNQSIRNLERRFFAFLGAGRGRETESYFFRFQMLKKNEPLLVRPYLNYFISFLYSLQFADRIIFGVSKTEHLRELLSRLEYVKVPDSPHQYLEERFKNWKKANQFDWKALR